MFRTLPTLATVTLCAVTSYSSIVPQAEQSKHCPDHLGAIEPQLLHIYCFFVFDMRLAQLFKAVILSSRKTYVQSYITKALYLKNTKVYYEPL